MANTKEIKIRMKSVSDTKKITNAMYLIASTKLRKAKEKLEATRPYFDSLKTEIAGIFDRVHNVNSRYFFEGDKPKDSETFALLVIFADKGLAGAYNSNIIKEADKLLKKHPNTRLFVVGEYGRQYYRSKGIEIEKSFLYSAMSPSMNRAKEISEHLLSLYNDESVDEIFVVYTDMVRGLEGVPVTTRLLPFSKYHFLEDNDMEEDGTDTEYEFYPSPKTVVDSVIPSYLKGYIYSVLTDSFCSEQNARMNAMQAANHNADELLASLNAQYNSLRQGAITQEITEISAGARAQKKKIKKLLEMKKKAI